MPIKDDRSGLVIFDWNASVLDDRLLIKTRQQNPADHSPQPQPNPSIKPAEQSNIPPGEAKTWDSDNVRVDANWFSNCDHRLQALEMASRMEGFGELKATVAAVQAEVVDLKRDARDAAQAHDGSLASLKGCIEKSLRDAKDVSRQQFRWSLAIMLLLTAGILVWLPDSLPRILPNSWNPRETALLQCICSIAVLAAAAALIKPRTLAQKIVPTALTLAVGTMLGLLVNSRCSGAATKPPAVPAEQTERTPPALPEALQENPASPPPGR